MINHRAGHVFTVALGLKMAECWMGGEAPPPLPVCDRCHHFLVREEGVSTCGPCRKAYQLSVSVRNVIPADKDESAGGVFLRLFQPPRRLAR